jgi:hypothetical protein
MRLKSFGCSFIFGSDLADSKKHLDDHNQAVPSQSTWPALLASNLQLPYECFASPGSGNFKILEKVLTQAATDTDSIFVIGWTFIDRYDYLVKTYTQGHFDPVNHEFWATLRPSDYETASKNYYQDLFEFFIKLN